MQSIIDASSAVCESAGIKRAASPLSPCVSSSAEHHRPLPQHEFPCPTGQVCQHKRLRTSNPHPILKTQNTPAASARSPPIVWRDFRNREFKMVKDARKPDYEALDPRDRMSNMIAKTATPFTSTQHSRPGMEPQGPSDSKPHGRLRNFFTKASIKTPRGIVDLERVQVDERSPFNLVPWSIATNLDLMLYSGKTWAITIADRLVRTNQYSQFTIRVAGHNTTINTGVIYGLQTILLGREWIRSVHLLNDFGNQNYYIPVPLAVEAAEEKFPGIVDTEVEAKDVKPVEMVTPDEIAEEHDDDEFSKADCGDDDSSNGRSSLDDDPFSESEPSFDGQTLSDGDTPFDEPSLGDDTLSDGGTSSEGPIFGEDEVTPTDEDGEDDEVDEHDQDHDEDDEDGNEDDHKDEDENDDGDDDGDDDENDNEDDDEDDDIFCEDYEGYKGHEGKVCDECVGYDECEGCDECEGYDECEGCEECKGYDECEGCEECEGNEEYGEFREGHEYQEGEEDPDDNLQDFVEQYTHLERFVDIEQTKEAYRQHSESKGEPVSAAPLFSYPVNDCCFILGITQLLPNSQPGVCSVRSHQVPSECSSGSYHKAPNQRNCQYLEPYQSDSSRSELQGTSRTAMA